MRIRYALYGLFVFLTVSAQLDAQGFKTKATTAADLTVTKTDSPDPVAAGANLTYTISLTNSGPDAAVSVVLSESVPANTTFVSMTQNTGPVFVLVTPAVGGTGAISGTLANMLSGDIATFSLVVRVNASTPNGTILSNTATTSSNTFDQNGANNSVTATTTVQTQADLAVTKTDSPDPVPLGGDITYALTFVNNGPSDALNAVLTDNVPAGTLFVSMVQNTGPAAVLATPPFGGSGPVTATFANFTAGTSATFTMIVSIGATPGGSTITNTVTATSLAGDPAIGNNTATATTTVAAAVPALGSWQFMLFAAAMLLVAAGLLARRRHSARA